MNNPADTMAPSKKSKGMGDLPLQPVAGLDEQGADGKENENCTDEDDVEHGALRS